MDASCTDVVSDRGYRLRQSSTMVAMIRVRTGCQLSEPSTCDNLAKAMGDDRRKGTRRPFCRRKVARGPSGLSARGKPRSLAAGSRPHDGPQSDGTDVWSVPSDLCPHSLSRPFRPRVFRRSRLRVSDVAYRQLADDTFFSSKTTPGLRRRSVLGGFLFFSVLSRFF